MPILEGSQATDERCLSPTKGANPQATLRLSRPPAASASPQASICSQRRGVRWQHALVHASGLRSRRCRSTVGARERTGR
jgi:hypothetical protein